MVKFGGSGRSKQSCVERKCPNMAVQVAEDDEEPENLLETENVEVVDIDFDHHKVKRVIKSDVIKWEGPVLKKVDGKCFYSAVDVNGMRVEMGGHVAVQPAEEGLSMYLAEVVSMWEEEKSKEKFFHAR